MIAFAMALLGCVLIMYKAIWYDQFTCPDGFLLRVRPGPAGGRGGAGWAGPPQVPAEAWQVGCPPQGGPLGPP